ncbi:MAG TPA: VOC family protein [Longimicrobium sp.]|nr:VOC family protein [Longimicrobium sp.]
MMNTTTRWSADGPPAVQAGYGIAPAGYRLPDATRLGRVVLQVADLERSLAYYEGVLGFRALERGGGSAVLAAHGDDAPLVELRERPGAAPAPGRGKLGLYHFAILLPDRAALGRFVAHLAETGERAGASDHFVSEALYLHDPDGLGIEVYADRPRSIWRHSGRQLVMATEPLDLPGLVRAAGGARWTGMPAGTTIGHVHLHVGDLERAAAFYHDGVGLDAVVWSYPGALFLSAGGYHHHLGLNTWAGPGAVPARDDDARLLEWEIVLPTSDDGERAAASLAAAGAEVGRAARGWTAADPWGTALRLVPAA